MTVAEWVVSNLVTEHGELVMSITIGIIFLLVHDFYHVLFSAVLSWFKKS